MPTRLQAGTAGHAFHVANRCWPNELLFDTPKAYRAFCYLIGETQDANPIRILAFCLMPTHFHFLLWPEEDRQVSRFIGALTQAHAKRLRKYRNSEGSGPVYPDRYMRVLLPRELNLVRAARYIERNPVKAGFKRRVEEWPWSSGAPGAAAYFDLTPFPGGKPANWREFVNQEEPPRALAALRAQLYETRKTRRSHK
jgi:putative transposase